MVVFADFEVGLLIVIGLLAIDLTGFVCRLDCEMDSLFAGVYFYLFYLVRLRICCVTVCCV